MVEMKVLLAAIYSKYRTVPGEGCTVESMAFDDQITSAVPYAQKCEISLNDSDGLLLLGTNTLSSILNLIQLSPSSAHPRVHCHPEFPIPIHQNYLIRLLRRSQCARILSFGLDCRRF